MKLEQQFIKQTDLTKDQFKEEVLAHKNELFTIEGTLPSESFLNNNIEIGDLNASDDDKTVSTNVKLNKANTSGESIQKTITLTGLGYQEVDLNGKTYTIAFKEAQDSQEIALNDQGANLVESLTKEQLMKLVIAKKDEILAIDGTDASKITNDVLENQILEITDLQPNKVEGKITFKLSVKKPTNGAGTTLEKTITFTGFKADADVTPPVVGKFKIKFNKDASEFTLTGVDQNAVTDFSTQETIQPVVINNKEVVFEAEEGNFPDEGWWTENLRITFKSANEQDGSITVDISLDNFDTTDSADPNNTTLTKENIVLKGFKPVSPSPFLK